MALFPGHAQLGGDGGAVQDPLKCAQFQASHANLLRGFVLTWGDACYSGDATWGTDGSGGNSSAVQNQLRNLQQIRASRSASAAILCDRSLVV